MLVSQSCHVCEGAQVLCTQALFCPRDRSPQRRPLVAMQTDVQALGPNGALRPPSPGHDMDGFRPARNGKESEARRGSHEPRRTRTGREAHRMPTCWRGQWAPERPHRRSPCVGCRSRQLEKLGLPRSTIFNQGNASPHMTTKFLHLLRLGSQISRY